MGLTTDAKEWPMYIVELVDRRSEENYGAVTCFVERAEALEWVRENESAYRKVGQMLVIVYREEE